MKKQLSIFLYGILAGFCIGLGGTVFLRLKDAFPGGNVVGALLFTIGLFTICCRGYNLFTGKACALFDNPPSYIFSLLVIWAGNFCGCLLLAGLERCTGLCGGETGIDAVARGMVAGKMSASLPGLFLLGILCNILIFIAVNGYANNPHELGKYLSLFFGVMVFILCGTEHSVADMYYFTVAAFGGFDPMSILFVLAIVVGNTLGGWLLPVLMRLGKGKETENESK